MYLIIMINIVDSINICGISYHSYLLEHHICCMMDKINNDISVLDRVLSHKNMLAIKSIESFLFLCSSSFLSLSIEIDIDYVSNYQN